MELLNWITLALAVVLWIMSQNIGASVGMASSAPVEKGSPQDILLDRTETLGGIAALGAVVAFTCELNPHPRCENCGNGYRGGFQCLPFRFWGIVWPQLREKLRPSERRASGID